MLLAGGGANDTPVVVGGTFSFNACNLPSGTYWGFGSALVLFAGGEFGYAMTFGGTITFNIGLAANDNVTSGYGSANLALQFLNDYFLN